MTRSLLGVLVSGCVVLAGCSSSTTADTSAYSGATGAERNAGAAPPSGAGSSSGGASTEAPPSGAPTGTPGDDVQAGLLTAGAWDDNLNYDFFGKYLAQSSTSVGRTIFTKAEHDAAHARVAQGGGAKTELDVAVVFDTTGSMGDELKYLQTEMHAIASTLNAKFPGTTPRFALVVYRDVHDEYLTRKFDFTANVGEFQGHLNQQSAGGGGDRPEAVPEGFEAGVGLSWRAEPNVAKLMFFVADAPQHTGTEPRVKAAVEAAVQKNVHVYPVAASGVDASAELTLREAAQYTGGRYLFLTDDSGVGNTHAEPHIPCYTVTRLDRAIVRMVQSEMTGARVEPAAEDVIRTVGNPVGGKCTIGDESQVTLY